MPVWALQRQTFRKECTAGELALDKLAVFAFGIRSGGRTLRNQLEIVSCNQRT